MYTTRCLFTRVCDRVGSFVFWGSMGGCAVAEVVLWAVGCGVGVVEGWSLFVGGWRGGIVEGRGK